jgi:hypothetical protein
MIPCTTVVIAPGRRGVSSVNRAGCDDTLYNCGNSSRSARGQLDFFFFPAIIFNILCVAFSIVCCVLAGMTHTAMNQQGKETTTGPPAYPATVGVVGGEAGQPGAVVAAV